MKYGILISILFLGACDSEKENDSKLSDRVLDSIYTKNTVINRDTLILLADTTGISSLKLTGFKIKGDFDGDGNSEVLLTRITSEAKFQEKPFDYILLSSSKKIKPYKNQTLSTSDSTVWIINEGDLNDKPGDEISLFLPPMNGFTYYMSTLTLSNNMWKEINSFVIPTAFLEGSSWKVEDMVYKENGSVYYLETDVNAENLKFNKKKITLK